MTENVKKLKELVEESENIVFFGGAGVSTESGIPDFRSTDGLYHQQYDYPPETILSHSFYESNPEEFFRFYRTKMLAPEARPNAAHRKLAELEAAADEIEQVIQNSLDREVSTTQIGELVMERLKPLDEVAYVRFASVYRQFKDINSFMRELNKILEEK